MTFELLPPRGLELTTIEAIKPFTDRLYAITVTDNPTASLRASSIAYGRVAHEVLGVEVIPNLSCRDRNLLGLQSEIIGAHLLGHRALFLITGDAPREKEGFKGVWEVNSTDLCRIVKGMSNGRAYVRGNHVDLTHSVGFSIGGALVFGRPNELQSFNKKIEAGFDYFITQIVYDAEPVIEFYREAEEAGTPVPRHVQIGLCPAATYKKFKAVSGMPGMKITEETRRRLEQAANYQEEVHSMLLNVADEVKNQLKGYSIGFHVMPLGSDALGRKLVEELTQ